MASRDLRIAHLWSGGLVTNYFCSSRCAHCLYGCSPAWEKRYIDANTAKKNLLKVKELGCHSVHIGGGEPLLRPEQLIDVLDAGTSAGVRIEYVETNSSWYKDLSEAVALLRDLRTHGLATLLISMSPFHNEHIPFYKVKGVLQACQISGMAVFPWIEDFYNEVSAFDESIPHELIEYEKKFGEHYIKQAVYRYYLAIRGRALSLAKRFSKPYPVRDILRSNSQGCADLTDTSHFHLDLFGNYIPGLCSGLAIERDDLGLPIDKDKYLFLGLLYKRGIGALYNLAKRDFGFVAKESYISKCDLCTDIRRFLVREKGIESADLQPAEYYGDCSFMS
jgi:hypothetical protein